MTRDEVQARIAKMIPGGLLLEFISYEHIVELMTVTQVITNLCLNEIEERVSLLTMLAASWCRTMPTSWSKPS